MDKTSRTYSIRSYPWSKSGLGKEMWKRAEESRLEKKEGKLEEPEKELLWEDGKVLSWEEGKDILWLEWEAVWWKEGFTLAGKEKEGWKEDATRKEFYHKRQVGRLNNRERKSSKLKKKTV